MEIKQTISFGIFMLIENILILVLIGDLIRRTSVKLYLIRHPHVYWTGGMIFLGYLLCIFVGNLSETYTGFMAYIIKDDSIEMTTVAARTFNRSMFLLAKFLLWYYLVKHNFEMFKNKF